VDFIRSVEFIISKKEITGAVNLASPNPLPNHEFLGVLRKAWGTRFGLPTTRWILELGTFLLRTESELVLKSRQVVPGRLLDAGFQFRYPTWPQAAQDLVGQWRSANL
jgi:NAD dependent epimerase/dehydratase family enzyme